MNPGDTFANRYHILYKIGEGGFGAVYRAKDHRLDRDVALKLLHSARFDNSRLARFHQEAKLTARLKHPNIVEILDFNIDAGIQPFLVLEYVDGSSLEDFVVDLTDVTDCESMLAGIAASNFDQFGLAHLVGIFVQICNAIEHSHKQGIVHRDIKPSNVIYANHEDGSVLVKVLDFGLATLSYVGREIDSGRLEGAAQRLTTEGAGIGSPLYMSPEQGRGEVPEICSDIYSIGCLFFAVLTGRPPFIADSVLGTIQQHFHDPIPSIIPYLPMEFQNDNLTAAKLDLVIKKCLAKSPRDRWSSAGELKESLLEALAENESMLTYMEAQNRRVDELITVSSALLDKERADDKRKIIIIFVVIILGAIPVITLCLNSISANVRAPGTKLEQENVGRPISKEDDLLGSSDILDRVGSGSGTYHYRLYHSDEQTKKLFETYPNPGKVRDLEIENAQELTGAFLPALGRFPLRFLRILHFNNLKDEFMQLLPDFPELYSLGLRDIYQIKGTHIESLGKYSGLRYLELTSSQIDDEAFRRLSLPPELIYLDLSGSKALTGSSFDKLSVLNKLEILNLSKCGLVDESIPFLDKLVSLKDLNISRCNALTGKYLQHSKVFSRLKKVSISESNFDPGILPFHEMSALKELIAVKCNFSSSFVQRLETNSLEKLNLDYTNIDDEQLERILRRNKKLETLSLNFCQNLSPSCLKRIGSSSTLQIINLSGFELPENGLRDLQAMPRLEFLTLQNVDLDFATVKKFLDNHPPSLRKLLITAQEDEDEDEAVRSQNQQKMKDDWDALEKSYSNLLTIKSKERDPFQ